MKSTSKKKVIIKGAIYTVNQKTPLQDKLLRFNEGYCDSRKKRIVLDSTQDDISLASTARHEILHAYFAECGLKEYERDEVLIEFLADQFPAICQLLNPFTPNE